MAVKIKKPELNIRKKKAGNAAGSASPAPSRPQAPVFGVPGTFETAPAAQSAAFAAAPDDTGFGVNVRNEAAGIKPMDPKKEFSWYLRELPHEIATSIALMSVIAFLLAAAYLPTAIPYALVGSLVYLGLVIVGEKLDVRFKYFGVAGAVALLILSFFLMKNYVGGGMGYIMNLVYDASESTQAYIYSRFGGGASEENPDLCIRAGVIWASILFGALGALPEAGARRAIGLAVAAAAMIAFAYYGLVPQALVAVLVIAAILFVMARGGLLSALPVLLAALLMFGAVMLISPGESIGISRVDENIRDRLALRSAYLENDVAPETPTEVTEPDERDPFEMNQEEFDGPPKWIVPVIIAGVLLLAIAAAIFLLYRRYTTRRDAHRAGIDSEDIRTAIISMFPYAVRWLGAADMEVEGKPFASLVEPLKGKVSEQYSNYYKSMYVLWREAAYSDHEMEEEKRTAMREFMKDTKEMVERDMNLKTKLKTALKYAL